MFHWRFPQESKLGVSCEPLTLHKQLGGALGLEVVQVGTDSELWHRVLDLGALVKQGLSSCDGCKEPSPCSVLVRHSKAAPLLCPELRWFLLGCVSLWEQQHSSGMCCVFGNSFPTAQPLSRAFGSAAVKV